MIIIRRIYKYPHIEDLYHFIYNLCEHSLLAIDPVIMLDTIILEIEKSFKIEVNPNIPIDTVYNELLKTSSINKILNNDLQNTIKKIETFENICRKYQVENDYFAFILQFIEIFKNAITYKTTKFIGLFAPGFTKQWVNAMSSNFKSPLVFYSDAVNLLVRDIDDTFKQAILHIFAFSIVFDKLNNESEIGTCPFFDEYNICKSELLDESLCLSDPYNIKQNENGEGCLLFNTLVLLGIK